MSPLDWGRGDTRRQKIPRDVIELVEKRLGGRFCALCDAGGLVTPPGEPIELDHIQPLSRGGDNHFSNLQFLCRAHNRGKRADHRWRGKPKWARKRS